MENEIQKGLAKKFKDYLKCNFKTFKYHEQRHKMGNRRTEKHGI